MVKTSISERSPLSPTHWPADAFIWWQSLLFAFALVAIIFVSGIPVLIAMVATGTVNRQELTGTHFNWVLFDV